MKATKPYMSVLDDAIVHYDRYQSRVGTLIRGVVVNTIMRTGTRFPESCHWYVYPKSGWEECEYDILIVKPDPDWAEILREIVSAGLPVGELPVSIGDTGIGVCTGCTEEEVFIILSPGIDAHDIVNLGGE